MRARDDASLELRAGLFVDLHDLERLRDDIEARWSWEVGKETGTNLDDDPPPDLALDRLKARYGALWLVIAGMALGAYRRRSRHLP